MAVRLPMLRLLRPAQPAFVAGEVIADDGGRAYARTHKDRGWRKFAGFYDLQPEEPESLARFAAPESNASEQTV